MHRCAVLKDIIGTPQLQPNQQLENNLDMRLTKQICMEEKNPGPCTAKLNKWYFEPRKLMCVPFVYGGCHGNRNNFHTIEECNKMCGAVKEDLSRVQQTGQPNTNLKSVDCQLTEWSNWSPCSATCGSAYSEKFRIMKRPAENGGKLCPKKLVTRKKCVNLPLC